MTSRHLEEIARVSTPDTERRPAALRAQQRVLQAQIDAIVGTNTAETFTAVQLTDGSGVLWN